MKLLSKLCFLEKETRRIRTKEIIKVITKENFAEVSNYLAQESALGERD